MVARLWCAFLAVPMLVLAAAGVRGTVVDPTGDATIAGAEIVLFAGADAKVVRNGSSDWNGQFVLDGLAAGEYEMTVSRQGFETRKVAPLSLADGEIRDLGKILLKLGLMPQCPTEFGPPEVSYLEADEVSLEGGVIGPGPYPLTNVTVRLVDRRARVRTISTDRNGNFKFGKLAPGKYRLDAALSGYTRFVMDTIEIKPGRAARITEPLELERCDKGLACPPTSKVKLLWVCL